VGGNIVGPTGAPKGCGTSSVPGRGGGAAEEELLARLEKHAVIIINHIRIHHAFHPLIKCRYLDLGRCW
jgi:hypothetical protein